MSVTDRGDAARLLDQNGIETVLSSTESVTDIPYMQSVLAKNGNLHIQKDNMATKRSKKRL